MAARSLLHKSKLDEFKNFLLGKGIATRPGKGSFQILQVEHPILGWQPIYEKLVSPEHYSVPDKLIPLVMEFVHPPKTLRSQPVYDIGQQWYVLLKGASALTEVDVLDITPRTVELRTLTLGASSVRYIKEDIDFVERLACIK
jgi:hypothetical protein